MPTLHTQYEGELTQTDGTKLALPPSVALIHHGPVVQVVISLSSTFASQLIQQGQQVPAPVAGLGLIDTGASSTCVDQSAATSMGLPVIDVVQMTSASHASTPANVYPVQLQIIGSPIRAEVGRALGANLTAQGLVALIGRDFLQSCTLFYNGITGQITLSI